MVAAVVAVVVERRRRYIEVFEILALAFARPD